VNRQGALEVLEGLPRVAELDKHGPAC
jgi:hypothetical protein